MHFVCPTQFHLEVGMEMVMEKNNSMRTISKSFIVCHPKTSLQCVQNPTVFNFTSFGEWECSNCQLSKLETSRYFCPGHLAHWKHLADSKKALGSFLVFFLFFFIAKADDGEEFVVGIFVLHRKWCVLFLQVHVYIHDIHIYIYKMYMSSLLTYCLSIIQRNCRERLGEPPQVVPNWFWSQVFTHEKSSRDYSDYSPSRWFKPWPFYHLVGDHQQPLQGVT